jgi:hypothetical protein
MASKNKEAKTGQFSKAAEKTCRYSSSCVVDVAIGRDRLISNAKTSAEIKISLKQRQTPNLGVLPNVRWLGKVIKRSAGRKILKVLSEKQD